jgi:hypothetical protein
MIKPPTAFVSYSWDSEAHKAWVSEFSARLRRNGVDVKLDQWDVKPGGSLTQFMESNATASDFVLVICTPEYSERSLAREGGVGYEQQIITGQLAAGIPRERFIPVLRKGEFQPGPKCGIPAQFFGTYTVDMRDDSKASDAFEQLIRVLHGVPVITRPELGSNPFEPPIRYSAHLRLPAIDLDGYELVSRVAQNSRHPESFEIPSDQDRNAVLTGQIVKLMFDIVTPSGLSCERMWVITEDRQGPYYIGRLDNMPAAKGTDLSVGSPITFLPEHIIEIHEK